MRCPACCPFALPKCNSPGSNAPSTAAAADKPAWAVLKVDSHLSVPRSCRPSLAEPQFSRWASHTIFLTLTPLRHDGQTLISALTPPPKSYPAKTLIAALWERDVPMRRRKSPYGTSVGDGSWTAARASTTTRPSTGSTCAPRTRSRALSRPSAYVNVSPRVPAPEPLASRWRSS
jgi:hypothetical protein